MKKEEPCQDVLGDMVMLHAIFEVGQAHNLGSSNWLVHKKKYDLGFEKHVGPETQRRLGTSILLVLLPS